MTGVSASMYAAGGAASRLGTIARGVLTPLTLAMTATALSAKAMSVVVKEASTLYLEFNDTLARTGAILGESEAGMGALEDKIREVGRTTRFTASEVGEAANKLAIAGVTADEMISDGALENLVKFAIAGGVDIETATNIGIAGVKAFGMEMDRLGFVSDVLTRTFTRSNVDIVSLGEGMKFAAPVAHSAGLAIEETAAAIGALGNAGLRGTVAGTGLRMSINKLLKPTFDSQKAINDLGLTVQVLSPAGEAAKSSLSGVARQLDATKMDTSRLTDELRILNGELTGLSIEQQANTLAIEQIRARAARTNRALTDMELAQIDRMEKANDGLRLSEMELDLERARKTQTLSVLTVQQKELQTEANTLTKTMEQQTTGLTSLGDVLDQLASAGATTTQVLEIFGVRGGTAMASLLSQREAFHGLVEENMAAAGATKDYMDALQGMTDGVGSAKEMLFVFNSIIQDGLLTVGKPFIDMLVQMSQLFGDDISKALTDNMPLFKELGFQIMGVMQAVVPMAIDALPAMINALKAIVPLITILAVAFRVLMAVLSPVLQLMSGIGQIVTGLVILFQALAEAVKAAFGKGSFKEAKRLSELGGAQMMMGAKDALIGGAITGLGIATGGAAFGVSGLGALAGGTMMKMGTARMIGAGTMGLTSMATDGAQQDLSGGIQKKFAQGGFVSSPTRALVGEDGPEVVIPLGAGKEGRRDALMGQAGLGGMNVNIGDIVINGGSNLSISEVRALMSNEMPRIIRQELLRGARGVI